MMTATTSLGPEHPDRTHGIDYYLDNVNDVDTEGLENDCSLALSIRSDPGASAAVTVPRLLGQLYNAGRAPRQHRHCAAITLMHAVAQPDRRCTAGRVRRIRECDMNCHIRNYNLPLF